MSGNESREATLNDILEELKSQRSKRKDFWDRLGPISTFISSVVIGIAGLWFTYSYNMAQTANNDRQISLNQETKKNEARVLEMQAVEKFIPYLTTEDEKKKEVALLVITTLGSPESPPSSLNLIHLRALRPLQIESWQAPKHRIKLSYLSLLQPGLAILSRHLVLPKLSRNPAGFTLVTTWLKSEGGKPGILNSAIPLTRRLLRHPC